MSPLTIDISSDVLGIFHTEDIGEDSIRTVNELLQHNHDKWHIYWRIPAGLHNHQVHYLLTDLSLGASPAQLQKAFDTNSEYQRPIEAGDESRQLSIKEETFAAGLGQVEYYAAWLEFYDNELDRKGAQQVLTEYLFSGTDRANDLLGRLYEGINPDCVVLLPIGCLLCVRRHPPNHSLWLWN